MNRLDELIRRCKKYDGEIHFKEGDIFVIADKQFIDIRNHYDGEQDVDIVHTVLREGNYIYYVCPNCSELHAIHKDDVETGKKYNVGCAINYKRSNKFGVIFPNGKMKKFKARKIMLAD